MKRTLVLITALAAGLATSTLAAQAPAAAATAAPQAVPAKVAIIAFEQAVLATNEGQKATNDVQKKYEPKKAAIDAQATEAENLKKQLQALPANAPDDQRASLIKNIDIKDKALQRDAEDASNAYQADLQEAYGKVAQKVGNTAVKYVQDNGFTLLLNVGGQQQTNPILWFATPTDVTQAVINEYNKVSGVAAPPPSAPAPARKPAAPAGK
jgi:outer membrane protein